MNLKGKKILVIGGGGKLGQVLVKDFGEFSSVTSLLRNDLDISDRDSVEKYILVHKPDVVFNAASFTKVDKCEEPKYVSEAFAVNADVPRYIVQACNKVGSLFVHFSTDYVFDGNNINGYDEDALPRPVNAYGWTKLAGERGIIEAGGKYFIIRTSRLFGPGGISETSRNGVVEEVIKTATHSKHFEVIDGELSCPTYSYDLVSATQSLIENDYKFGIYHVVNSEPCTRFQFYKKIIESLRIKVEVMPVKELSVPRLAARPAFSVLHNTKFTKLRPWEEAFEKMLKRFYPAINK